MSDINNCIKFKCQQCGVNTFGIDRPNEISFSLVNKMCTSCTDEVVSKIIRGER